MQKKFTVLKRISLCFCVAGGLQRVMKPTDNISNPKIIIITKKLSCNPPLNMPCVEVAVRDSSGAEFIWLHSTPDKFLTVFQVQDTFGSIKYLHLYFCCNLTYRLRPVARTINDVPQM